MRSDDLGRTILDGDDAGFRVPGFARYVLRTVLRLVGTFPERLRICGWVACARDPARRGEDRSHALDLLGRELHQHVGEQGGGAVLRRGTKHEHHFIATISAIALDTIAAD